MSIQDKIGGYLLAHHRLTQAKALDKFCTSRLGSAIHRLRQQGYKIKTKMIQVKCRDGHKAYVAEYSL